jgi:hypothetical protein
MGKINYVATCNECSWSYGSDAKWLTHRNADIHRGVHAHEVRESEQL